MFTRKKMVLLRQQNQGQTLFFFVAATKNFAAETKRFVDRTKHFVVLTKYFCYPILTNDFVGITKPFILSSIQYEMKATSLQEERLLQRKRSGKFSRLLLAEIQRLL